jgi:predicted MFS family arabinose efflux permease
MNTLPLDRRATTSLLKNQEFRRLWVAQFSTITVLYGLSLAGAVLVEEQTQSSAQIGLVILSSIFPTVLGSLIAGAVVDQQGRVPVMMASHLARGLATVGFWGGLLLLPRTLMPVIVYTTNAVTAALSQFALSAEYAMLPDLVDHDQLTQANALLQLSMLAAEGLGIVVLAPLVIKLAGAATMGLVSAGLYLLALILVMGLPRNQPSASQQVGEETGKRDLGAELQAGWGTIAQDRVLSHVAINMTLAAALLLVLLSLLPGLLSRHLGLGVEDAPFLMLPGGVGFVVGAALISKAEGRLSRLGWNAGGLTGLGLSICVLALMSGGAMQVPLALILLPILGVGLTLAMVIIPARTALQERPPPELRGRVIAAQLAMANAAAVLPLLVGGTLADRYGIRPVMGVLGLLALGVGLISVRRARD